MAMRTFQHTINIAAPPTRVWDVISDVERWPEWTASVTEVVMTTGGSPAVGSRVRIRQPKLRPTEWTITDWRPGVRFTWVSKSLGLRATGDHAITPSPARADHCTLVLTLTFEGVLAGVVAFVGGNLVRRYMELEANGAKARSEAAR